jgi:hypothetical protein
MVVTLISGRDRIVSKKISILFACVLTLYVGATTLTVPNTANAEDKSTTISCDGVGDCEKTECVNSVCNTSPTNSSSIEDSQKAPSGAAEKDSGGKDNPRDIASDAAKHRLDIREEKLKEIK